MSTIKKDSAGKHPTFEDRIEIQDYLFHGVSFKGIGKRIGKDPTTVPREVKEHIQVIIVARIIARTSLLLSPLVRKILYMEIHGKVYTAKCLLLQSVYKA